MSSAAIDEIIVRGETKKTKQSTKWAIRVFEGSLGIPGSNRERNSSSQAFAPSMVYVSNQGMVYCAGAAPMAIPMQTAGGVVMVPVSSSGGVGGHPQTVQMPGGSVMQVVSQPQMYQSPMAGAVSMQPQMVQVPTSGAGALGGQAQMVQMPTSGAQGGQAPMVQVSQMGKPEGPPEFTRITPDVTVPAEKEPLP
ncbi:hypothetical protein AWC38_SpisGene21598 [Stylophora pistillata]|uniref:Uncharacterized protein n=1 Tax=Stylophora pistillata TaxID=50429 RepID=A0A2B4RCN7_STYPI|nr:hypothetical protein AWC38_SpisGene21598 [Stylophora pistillata]